MCTSCWEELGRPRLDTPKVREAAALIATLYQHQGVGGHFHIVTDDWNVDDENVAFCVAEAAAHAGGDSSSPVDAYLRELLTGMIEQERPSAHGLFEELWSVADPG